MNVNAISSFAPSYLLPLHRTSAGASSSNSASSIQQPADVLGVSPAARFLSQLQQLQTQSPVQFQAILSQLTNQLQQAASSAASGGNTAQANQLTQLAHSFQSAASGGALPSIQQLQQAGLAGQSHHAAGRYGAYSSVAETQNQSLAATLFNSLL
jgi:hypothetical protein